MIVRYFEGRILIVDDQIFNIIAIKVLIQSYLHVDPDLICDFAMNGKEALNKVIQNTKDNENNHTSYKLILMDCNMPLMDGMETSFKIRNFLWKRRIK